MKRILNRLLEYYRTYEGLAADPNEGITIIDHGHPKKGYIGTVNTCFVSCWSLWNEVDPWKELKESYFSKRKYVIVSSIEKVKLEIYKIILAAENKVQHINPIIYAYQGQVNYYPLSGVTNEDWEIKEKSSNDIRITTQLNEFHKPKQNEFGKNFEAEKEYRFALVINPGANLENDNFKNPSLISEGQDHYIDKILKFENEKVIELTIQDYLQLKN